MYLTVLGFLGVAAPFLGIKLGLGLLLDTLFSEASLDGSAAAFWPGERAEAEEARAALPNLGLSAVMILLMRWSACFFSSCRLFSSFLALHQARSLVVVC